MNEIKIFNSSQFGQIRTVMQNGEPWFIAADVCAALDILNTTDAIKRLDDDERARLNLGSSEANVVNEYGLYALVLGSRKKEARDFKRWITHEVLPTIRKTGGYVANDDLFIKSYLPNADEATEALFKATLATVRSLNAKIEQDKPAVAFANNVAISDGTILIRELAKLIKQSGRDMGEKRLYEWLRQNGYLIKGGSDKNMPTQRAMEMGLFVIHEGTINHGDSVRLTKTPRVTGKGQFYFVNKLAA